MQELGSALARPPADLSEACAQPVPVSGPLDRGTVRQLWSEDRAALGDCRRKHAALDAFYRTRDAALAGKK